MSSESSMVWFGLSTTSQRYFYLKTNHFSLKTNQPLTISSTFLWSLIFLRRSGNLVLLLTAYPTNFDAHYSFQNIFTMKAVDHADCRDQQTISEDIPTKKSQNLELNTRISRGSQAHFRHHHCRGGTRWQIDTQLSE
jgi:hypothetical protein